MFGCPENPERCSKLQKTFRDVHEPARTRQMVGPRNTRNTRKINRAALTRFSFPCVPCIPWASSAFRRPTSSRAAAGAERLRAEAAAESRLQVIAIHASDEIV